MTDIITTTDTPVDPDAFVDALLESGDLKTAAKECGIPLPRAKTIGRSVPIVRSMRERAKARIGTDLLAKAVRTLEACMEPGNPPPTRLKAAMAVLAMAGLATGEDDDASGKRLEDMTADELNAFIRRADGELDRRPGAARLIGAGKAG